MAPGHTSVLAMKIESYLPVTSIAATAKVVLAGRFCAGDSRKLKTRKPQRLLVECQGAGTTRSRAERCHDSVGE